MNRFNKSYRIRTEVGKDKELHVKLDRDYDVLEIMSLKINQENAYKLHSSNYGVIAGRVLANDALGVPNAKISVFINIDEEDSIDTIKSVIYPYYTTKTSNNDGVRYNLLVDEQISDCHTIIGTFPEKQYMLDNDSLLEVFDKYYKYTTRTNNSGDFMIFGVPTGSQTIHVDIDLSDIGFLSQKPRDMVYKGYNIEQFENPNKFKYDTNIDSLTQVITQDEIVNVIPFWGDESEGIIGITRCDINIQYKFEPTCVFLGSVVSDSSSNGISKKCIPTPGMGSMEEITTGSGTIEMIRKTPSGGVEEFQIKGTQLINGDGVWCYQIPMNLDYVMTDEFGNMVPTDNPEKGIPTRTKVRFRLSLQDFENENTNMIRSKVLVPHNPDVFSDNYSDEIDYNFGTLTKETSYRDLFWNGVYSVKSYIPRIQKGANWKNEKFTGFKRINYHGDKNPMPYNNIRIRIPFMYTIMCMIIKSMIRSIGFLNRIFRICAKSFVKQDDDESGSFITLSGELCSDNLENLCIIPGVDIQSIAKNNKKNRSTLLGNTIIKFYNDLGGDIDLNSLSEDKQRLDDEKSIDYTNGNTEKNAPSKEIGELQYETNEKGGKSNPRVSLKLFGLRVTDSVDYLIECVEMNLAQEYKVIQFDFYNDWINGVIYIPRWMRTITKKRKFLWGAIKIGGKVKACNKEYKSSRRNLVQQCGLSYSVNTKAKNVIDVNNNVECTKNGKMRCHKSVEVRKVKQIFKQNGVLESFEAKKDDTVQYVYYFKPIEEKYVRLFATDIILLGTLNNCDKFGIPNELSELVSSTYQMPPNLALTDSDLEGNDYTTNNTADYIYMMVRENKGIINDISLNNCYIGMSRMGEYGNYTEMSGINWGYSGPLQDAKSYTNFYKPGGHFLGISCRNSQTTIKTCVNLSRICEYGVWMSQRHELNIPNKDSKSPITAFENYATVPNGLISKDEISGTNYRRTFASLNHNKLRTKLDSNNRLTYDFIYLNPTNFMGELNNKVMTDSNYNRYISDMVVEKYYNYTDDDYYESEQVASKTVKESQIIRSGEFSDNEYIKFRFGLNDNNFNDDEIRKHFLLNSNGIVSFPVYENSFYFYFGLHDGKTAIDEFKKMYYSVCPKQNNFKQIDNSIKVNNLTVSYDGVCGDGSGIVNFKLNINGGLFDDNGSFKIELISEKDNTIKGEQNVTKNGETVIFTNLPSDNYNITITYNKDSSIYENVGIEVKQIKLTSDIKGSNFKKTIDDKETISNILNKDYDEYGGYIILPGKLKYETEEGVSELPISDYITDIKITGYNNCEIKSTSINEVLKKLQFTENGITYFIEPKYDTKIDAYKVRVPKDGVKYNVYVKTKLDGNGKITENNGIVSNNKCGSYEWSLGSVQINNALKMAMIYNDVSYDAVIKKYVENAKTNGAKFSDVGINIDNININDNKKWFNGWWNVSSDSDKAQWATDENGDILWNIKSALYMETKKTPHSVPIKVMGGETPHTITVIRKNGDNDITDLDNITASTINCGLSENQNFIYKCMDANGQIVPNNADYFEFPVIYKPFFMESILCYFTNKDKYVLYGDVYNGRTWDYEYEGFNDCKLNNIILSNAVKIEDDDTIFKKYTTTEDGKYYGRRSILNKEIDGSFYGLNNSTLSNTTLSIGTMHIEGSKTYSSNTYITKKGLSFGNFSFDFYEKNNVLYINIISPDSNVYSCYMLDNEKYAYPYSNENGFTMTDELFSGIIGPTLKGDVPNNICVNDKNYSGKAIYFVAIINDNSKTETISTYNDENKLKTVTFSDLIEIDKLNKFYPLDIDLICYVSSDKTKATLNIKPMENSKENFKNKRIEIRFFKKENESNKSTLKILTFDTYDNTELTSNITDYINELLGMKLNDNDITNKSVDYEYYVYIGDEKSPVAYESKTMEINSES